MAGDANARGGVLDTAGDRVVTGDGRASGPAGTVAPEARDGDAAGSRLQRWFWFGALWLGGVGAVSLVAWAIRATIMP